MVNVVREAVDCAHGGLLLWGVAAGSIVLRHPGDNHLGVAFGTQSTALEEGLPKVHAAGVNIQPSIDVVEGIDDQVQALKVGQERIVWTQGRTLNTSRWNAIPTHLPERIVEDLLRLRRDTVLEGIDLDLWVELAGGIRGYRRLGTGDHA